MKYKAIIFDLFGTLVDNRFIPSYRQMLAEMAQAVSSPPDEYIRLWDETFDMRATGVLKSIEMNVMHICDRLHLKPPDEGVATATKIRLEFSRHALSPRDDVIDTLTQLRASGHSIGLISNCAPDTPLLWPETHLASLVDVPVFSCLEGCTKPDPRIYLTTCSRLGVSPQSCLYIGDGGSFELSAASRLGMHSVLIQVENCNATEDPFRREAQTWEGVRVSAIKDILDLVY